MVASVEIGTAVPQETRRFKRSLDLDDTGVFRERPTRVLGELWARIHPHVSRIRSIAEIPILNHTPIDSPIKSIKEALSLAFHYKRQAIPGVAARMRKAAAENNPYLVISGRRATEIWDQATRAQLEREKMPYEDLVLTPAGVSTIVSKADAIRQYEVDEHADDNWPTIDTLSRIFPDKKFIFVNHGLRKISKKDLDGRTNITQVSIAQWNNPDLEVEQIEPLSVSATRNSFLRRRLAFIPERIAKTIIDINEDTNPNLITASSGVITAITSFQATRRLLDGTIHFKSSLKELLKIGVAQLLDWFDGSVAREKIRRDPESHDTKWGGMWDTLNDRFGHLTMGISRMVAASDRGDALGKAAAAAATITGVGPSYLRAKREGEGKTVPESGRGLLEFFGTHPGRTALAVIGTLWPYARFKKFGREITIPIQFLADLASTAANLKVMRARATGEPIKISLTDNLKEFEEACRKLENTIDEGNFKAKGLGIAAAVTGIATVGTLAILSRK